MNEWNAEDSGAVRAGQIIAAAMMAGIVLFALIACLVIAPMARQEGPSGNLVSMILAVISLVQLSSMGFVSQIIKVAQAPPQRDATSLNGIWRTQTIVRLAICEGAAFLNIIAYLVEQNWWSLAIAAAILLLMLIQFPTETKLRHFREQQQLADQNRVSN